MTSLNETILELTAPSIPYARPNFPGSQYNLMPINDLNPMEVRIPQWPDSDKAAPMILTISIGRDQQPSEDVATYTLYGPLDFRNFPFKGAIPAQYLALEGVYEVGYDVKIEENTQTSLSNQFTIDRTAPNKNLPGESPIFPLSVINEGVTSQYLQDHNDEVIVEIPVYTDQREGDLISFYFGSFTDGPVLRTTVSDSISRTLIRLSGETIRKKGNGDQFTYYILDDRADNQGPHSKSKSIVVALS
ncbi:hypothetical protein [Pseudomonas sp. P1.31]|uniref:hypothetical protein n=1 Tax=Pseudomonas sp. P1.31 TaxID=1699311 RepID=UPI00069E85F5|nr:hypothetical protein [Pseudomonas sp. P1.31]